MIITFFNSKCIIYYHYFNFNLFQLDKQLQWIFIIFVETTIALWSTADHPVTSIYT